MSGRYRSRQVCIIAAATVVAYTAPASAGFADLSAAEQHALAKTLGISETVSVDGRTIRLATVAKNVAVQERRRRSRPRVALANVSALLREPVAVAPTQSSIAGGPSGRDAVIPVSPVGSIIAPAPVVIPVATSVPNDVPNVFKAAAHVLNFFADLKNACPKNWIFRGGVCNADLTFGSPRAWPAGPPSASASPDTGSGDASAVPPELQSVERAGPTASQAMLTADLVSIRSLHPPLSGGTGPSALMTALRTAATKPAYLSATNMPAIAMHATGLVGDVANDFVRLTFDGSVTAPDFLTDNSKDAVFGLTATAKATLDMQLTILQQPFPVSVDVATIAAQSALPLGSTSPYLDVQTNILGVAGNKHDSYSAIGPSLAYGEARKQTQTINACSFNPRFQLPFPDINLTLSLTCPLTVGYVMHMNAVPAEASISITPVAAVGLEGSATLSGAGGLLSISVVASANLLVVDGRLGTYFDMVRNPSPELPAYAQDVYVASRPYGFATARTLNGSLYLVARCGNRVLNLKLKDWKALASHDFDETPAYSAYRLVAAKHQ